MRAQFLLSLISLFFICACSHFHSQREQPNDLAIKKDAIGTRWVDVPVKLSTSNEQCVARVLSFQQSHMRLALESHAQENPDCELAAPQVLEALIPAAKAVKDSYSSQKTEKVLIDLPLSQSPRLFIAWAIFLKNSPKWQNRKKQKDPWDTSEYKLIKELLLESQIFGVYQQIFDLFPDHTKRELHIEKVDYQAAAKTPMFESTLKPAGYFPQERIPTPLMVSIIFSN